MEKILLGSIADIQTGPFGSQLHKEDYVQDGTPIVTVEHLGNRVFTEQNLPMVSDADKERLNKYVLSEGDIVFSRVGSVDRCSYVDSNHSGWMFSGRCLRVRPYNAIYPLYLYYFFCMESTKQFVRNIAVGATMPSINTKLMGEIEVSVPSIDTQKRIAAILSTIDDKIELNTAINENLEQQAQALFKAWFVDFEPFGGVMPDDWKIISLGKLCDSISKKHKFNKDELIFLNTGDVENGMILHNNYSEVSQMPGQAKKSIAINDILYSEIRPINKHFAYVNFVADDYVVSTKLMVLRAKGISPRRLYQFLTMPDTLKELQVEAESRSGTFPQIRFDNIQQLEMIVASEQVEKEYSERLNTIYSMIDTNNSENKRLSALRDTLLPKLMNGEIDVSAVRV